MKNETIRDTNVEFMRIILMFFVVFLHCITHSELLNGNEDYYTFNCVNFVRGFILVAVNCFILISGYYGIKFKLKSVLNIYIMCFTYGTIVYIIHLFVDNQSIGHSLIYNSIFCISFSKLWFIPCYLILYCLSPLLNFSINGMTRRQYNKALIVLTIINVYFGWFWGKDFSSNVNGFTVFQMIYVYFIGGYLKRYSHCSQNAQKIRYILIYILATVIWWIITCLKNRYAVPGNVIAEHWQPNRYNNPFIIIASIAFFCIFISSKIHLHTSYIHKIARCLLAVYVLHDLPYISNWIGNGIKEIVSFELVKTNLLIKLLVLAICSSLILFLIIPIERIRIRLMKPFNKFIDKVNVEF